MVRSSAPVEAVLSELGPDRIEVSDKLTLHRLGRWTRARGVPSVLLSHERIDAILAPCVPRGFPLRCVADRRNRQLARDFDTIVCASAFAAAEFERVGASNVRRIPLGVDLTRFHPSRRVPSQRGVRLVCLGRLSREKRTSLAIDTLRRLVDGGLDAHLVIVGDGPQHRSLATRAQGLPVEFAGAVSHDALAGILASADAALAPCPFETFGLAALEALASGTPVVCSEQGALPELVTGLSGRVAPPDPAAFADAVRAVLAHPTPDRRAAARHRAEQFSWSRTVAAMLDAHTLPVAHPRAA
jgi:alpha-1,6-mannosyltransferase